MTEATNILPASYEPVEPQLVAQMMFFTVLVEACSMTKASEVMNISTSTGSRWLSDLESELNVSLYRRNDKVNRITEAGEHLYNTFKHISSDMQILKNELTQFTQEKRGTVRICSSPVYAENVILPLISEFVRENPMVNIQMTISPRGLEQHKDNDFIISAIAGSAIAKEEALNLVRRNLLSERFVVVASPEFIRYNSEPLVPEDLTELRCLYSKSLSGKNHWVFKKGNEAQIITVNKTIELSDAKMITTGVLNGAGVAYLPEFLVKKYIRSGQLIELLTEYETDDWFLNLYYPPQRFMTSTVSAFKEHLLSNHREKLKVFE
ncbi:LysR family transcriptional regulator [Vibrio rarus]|uniref:LysR family transcriptional regulator n=1 Tax=Vibrio rarus TaxID=413403 RepID=UPI0021C41EB8|nr:LysR family transcriptional regulator [Vibrio rarus]